MQIIRKSDIPKRTYKFNETMETRGYYMPQNTPLEVIRINVNKNCIEKIHRHKSTSEAILVMEGELIVEEFKEDGTKTWEVNLCEDDLVIFDENEYHRMKTGEDKTAKTITIKFLGEISSKKLFRYDKEEFSNKKLGEK